MVGWSVSQPVGQLFGWSFVDWLVSLSVSACTSTVGESICWFSSLSTCLPACLSFFMCQNCQEKIIATRQEVSKMIAIVA